MALKQGQMSSADADLVKSQILQFDGLICSHGKILNKTNELWLRLSLCESFDFKWKPHALYTSFASNQWGIKDHYMAHKNIHVSGLHTMKDCECHGKKEKAGRAGKVDPDFVKYHILQFDGLICSHGNVLNRNNELWLRISESLDGKWKPDTLHKFFCGNRLGLKDHYMKHKKIRVPEPDNYMIDCECNGKTPRRKVDPDFVKSQILHFDGLIGSDGKSVKASDKLWLRISESLDGKWKPDTVRSLFSQNYLGIKDHYLSHKNIHIEDAPTIQEQMETNSDDCDDSRDDGDGDYGSSDEDDESMEFKIKISAEEWERLKPQIQLKYDGKNITKRTVIKRSDWRYMIISYMSHFYRVPCSYAIQNIRIRAAPFPYLKISAKCADPLCGAFAIGRVATAPQSGEQCVLKWSAPSARGIPHSMRVPIRGRYGEETKLALRESPESVKRKYPAELSMDDDYTDPTYSPSDDDSPTAKRNDGSKLLAHQGNSELAEGGTEMTPKRVGGRPKVDRDFLKSQILHFDGLIGSDGKLLSKTDELWLRVNESLGGKWKPGTLYTLLCRNQWGIKDHYLAHKNNRMVETPTNQKPMEDCINSGICGNGDVGRMEECESQVDSEREAALAFLKQLNGSSRKRTKTELMTPPQSGKKPSISPTVRLQPPKIEPGNLSAGAEPKPKEDQYDLFGKYMASQLREMPLRNFLTVQCKILELISTERLEYSS